MPDNGSGPPTPNRRPDDANVPGAWGYSYVPSSEDELRVPLASTAKTTDKLWVAHRPWSTIVVVVMWIVVIFAVIAVLRDAISAATVPTSLPGVDEDAPRIQVDPAVVSEARTMYITATMFALVYAAAAIWWLTEWVKARASAELGAPRRIRVVTTVTLLTVLVVATAIVVAFVALTSQLKVFAALAGIPDVEGLSIVVKVVAGIYLFPVVVLALVLVRLLVAVFSKRSSSTVAPIRRRR